MPVRTEIDAAPQDHKVLFYGADDELTDAVASYIADALLDGAVAIVIATQAHREAFDLALSRLGLDATTAQASGSLITLDAAETLAQCVVDGSPDPQRFAAAVGRVIRNAAATGRDVRAYGEMVALLWDAGQVAGAMELEALWNALREQTSFALLCAYPSAAVSGQDLAPAVEHICRLHSSVVGRRSVRVAATDEMYVKAVRSRSLENDGRAAQDARRFVGRVLAEWGQLELVGDASIVVTELVTNAARHGGSSATVTLSSLLDGAVRVGVTDGGGALPQMRDPRTSDLSGRGLPIIAGIARRWGWDMQAEGKTVWAELSARGSRRNRHGSDG